MSSAVVAVRESTDPAKPGVTIVIEHLPRDSYPRSVGPRASRELQGVSARMILVRAGFTGGTVHESWDYESERDSTPAGKCRTAITYSIEPATRESVGIPEFGKRA